ncbi:MAG: hypothetical protein M1813_000217 [Trichoglossum hirsutum]|nr:MAG: hypothetical protein M1813_000217 [Trichoglossum hirsutum]
MSSLPAESYSYRDEWLQTQTYPSASSQHQNRLPAAIPLPLPLSLPPPAATKTSVHTLRYSYDNVATISVHNASSHHISSPEACDCPSSNSSSGSYSQPTSPHRSITRSSEIPVSELGATGNTADGDQNPQQDQGHQERRQQQHQHRAITDDAEKQADLRVDGTGNPRQNLGPNWRHRWRATACRNSSLANDSEIEGMTPRILIFLALINPLLSLILAIYTFLIVTFLILCLPIQICTPTPTFAARVTGHLCPALRLHFALIHSLVDGQPDNCHAVRLILLHLTSPLLALGTAVCTWVAAVFWVYAAMLGDPDGRGRRDDGRGAVLSVRRYWERILCWPLR